MLRFHRHLSLDGSSIPPHRHRADSPHRFLPDPNSHSARSPRACFKLQTRSVGPPPGTARLAAAPRYPDQRTVSWMLQLSCLCHGERFAPPPQGAEPPPLTDLRPNPLPAPDHRAADQLLAPGTAGKGQMDGPCAHDRPHDWLPKPR